MKESSDGKWLQFLKPNLTKKETTTSEARLVLGKEERDYLGKGAEGVITRAWAEKETRRIGGLAFKEYHSEGSAAHALKAWMYLKSAGIEVPTTFRLAKDGDRYIGILMDDLTNGWENILVTTNETKRYILENVYKTRPEVVESFINLKQADYLENIEKQIDDIAQKAAHNGIVFTGSDILSVVFDGKDVKVIISDMGNVQFDTQGKYEDLLKENADTSSLLPVLVSQTQEIAREVISDHKK